MLPDFARVLNYDTPGMNTLDFRGGGPLDIFALSRADPASIAIPDFVGEPPFPDWVDNPAGWPIVSTRLARHIQSYSNSSFEFLHFSIFNKRNMVVQHDLVAVNILTTCDCLDIANTNVGRDEIDQEIVTIQDIVIYTPKWNGKNIFRFSQCPSTAVIFARSFLQTLFGHSFTGLCFVPCK
jgi:hypothetical protein